MEETQNRQMDKEQVATNLSEIPTRPCLGHRQPDLRITPINDRLADGFAVRACNTCVFTLPKGPTKSNGSGIDWRISKRSQAEVSLKPGISEPNTDTVINRAQNGDARAMTELYNQYKPAIYRYLYHRSGTRQVAEELTTEVFIRVIENLHRYQSRNLPFQAWLFRIARNLAVDHFRSNRARQEIVLEDNMVATNGATESIVERNLDVKQLHQALLSLTPDQCDVIALRFLADMPISQVAHVLNKSQGAVKMLQARALDALYQMMKQKHNYG